MIKRICQLPRQLHYLFAGTLVTRLGTFVFPYLTIYLSEARQFGVDRVGLILSVGSIGLLIGNYSGGWLADRWSRKRTLIVALVLNAIGFAALAGSYESGWMYALFLFIGYTGSGMYTPAANTVIADLTTDDTRRFAYTCNYVCINLGMGLGPLMAGFLAAYSYAWIFIGDVVTSIVCAILIAVALTESGRRFRAARPRLNELGRASLVWLRHPMVLLFCLANFFLVCPLMGLEYSVPLLVKTEFESPLSYVGIVYTINAISILALSFFIERWLRGRDDMLMMAVAGLFWTVGLVVLLSGFSVGALLLCTAIWTIGEIIASILVPSYIAKHVAEEVKGRFMALNDIVRSLAGVVCPIGLGFLWHHQGVTAVLYVLVALPVLGTAAYLLLLVHQTISRRTPSPQSLMVES